VIPNIEHYANEHDPIPRWGVLHAYKALFETRYNGKLFVRRGTSGHFFTSHYLAAWFPLDTSSADFMKNQEVTVQGPAAYGKSDTTEPYVPRSQTYDSMLEEAAQMEWGNGRPATKTDLERMEAARKRLGQGQFYALGNTHRYSKKMQRISRLWQYVDGACPD
jgi:hypothetical protein